jgi:hypothetical protein
MTTSNYVELIELAKLGRKTKTRRKALGTFISGLVTNCLVTLSNAWMFMLAVGVAHAEWIRQLPTVGYWTSVLLVVLLKGVFSAYRPTSKGAS